MKPDEPDREAETRDADIETPLTLEELRREIDLGLRDIEEGRVSEWSLEEVEEYIRGLKHGNDTT